MKALNFNQMEMLTGGVCDPRFDSVPFGGGCTNLCDILRTVAPPFEGSICPA